MLARVTDACDQVVARKYQEAGRRRASLANVLPENDVFLDLLKWETTVPLVVQLLSFNLRLAKSHIIYKYPDVPNEAPSRNWHRDFMETPDDLGPHRYPRVLIKVVYQLSDTTTKSTGNTLILPRSNNLTRKLEFPEGQTDPTGAVALELRAGDAYLFESRTFHSIGENYTSVPRKCLMMGYSYGWISPLDYDVQPPWLLEKISDPISRQLVGAEKDKESRVKPDALAAWTERHGVRRASEIEYDRLTKNSSNLT
jgi:ectoine hydroxylase-related dioxygenase (phytanoyl-CoA dioxygenase family)